MCYLCFKGGERIVVSYHMRSPAPLTINRHLSLFSARKILLRPSPEDGPLEAFFSGTIHKDYRVAKAFPACLK